MLDAVAATAIVWFRCPASLDAIQLRLKLPDAGELRLQFLREQIELSPEHRDLAGVISPRCPGCALPSRLAALPFRALRTHRAGASSSSALSGRSLSAGSFRHFGGEYGSRVSRRQIVLRRIRAG